MRKGIALIISLLLIFSGAVFVRGAAGLAHDAHAGSMAADACGDQGCGSSSQDAGQSCARHCLSMGITEAAGALPVASVVLGTALVFVLALVAPFGTSGGLHQKFRGHLEKILLRRRLASVILIN
ncbi:hypothetical protein A3F28_03045 [Candidatus Uhrbacteria bacterium RIFCSPHIGHO2_12_FULL_57_11]|uniref:Uncharacterized protein n=2 Tax=Candidatus Uhriibacteriota TaxID=1752732 RepID=A0A1F7UIA1_9BACT|nr:MAG: hypothetical protein A3D72_02450 [Candidatus Uhrbacteria bacterium RIFCSPHIGHO2_02_FULL_57_19]OGL78016.1 MAG: hypothetical protein A3F28_03045 [Candidatus Uhrbacteria bacterium RIFCSPHIGHO2_12_FULL_57_11]